MPFELGTNLSHRGCWLEAYHLCASAHNEGCLELPGLPLCAHKHCMSQENTYLVSLWIMSSQIVS